MNKKELFQIGEVARLFNVSVSTLRHYEKIGLLPPEYIDNKTGYRYYGTNQFECLNTIRYLRALDTPLEQITMFLKNRNLDNIQSILKLQKEEISKKRRELEIIEKKIDNRLFQLDDALHSELDRVEVVKIPRRRIAWIKHDSPVETYLDLEMPIRRLDNRRQETVVFLGKVGVGISEENLSRRSFSKYDRVFLILDDEDIYEGETVRLSESLGVGIRFCGTHKEAPLYYRKLIDFIDDENMQIAGFSFEITMIDYGYTSETDKFVTEIQIPITPKQSKNELYKC